MSSSRAERRRAGQRSRRQRLAAGAVLASTTLLGTYLAAVRPQPTYASPNKGGAGQGQDRDPSGRSFGASFVLPACQVTVDDSTELHNAILGSRDDSVICVDGRITLTAPLPSIDDTRLTLRGLSGDSLDDSIVVNRDDSVAVDSIIRGTFTTTDDTLTVADLGFSGGSAQGPQPGNGPGGGAVRLAGTGSGRAKLVVQDSTFTLNKGDSGAFRGDGGAIAVDRGDIYIHGSEFASNLTQRGVGGAVSVIGGNVRVDGRSRFTNNAARGASGGAIYVKGGNGSVQYASRVTIADSIFTGNETSSSGGAVAVSRPGGDVTITGSTFEGNNADLGGISGGALYVNAMGNNAPFDVVIGGSSVFRNNSAPSWAGAVYVGAGTNSSADLVIADGVQFSGNHVTSGHGGAVYVWGRGELSTTITDASFRDDSATGNGGAIYIGKGPLGISNVTIEGASAGSRGGAIYITDDSVTASYVSLIDNHAGQKGGAVYAKSGVPVYLINSYVGGNEAAEGGAIFANSGRVSLEFSTIYDNSSSTVGIAEAIRAGGRLTAVGSLVGNPQDDTVVTAGSIDDTFAVSTGTSQVFTGTGSQRVSPNALALGSRDGSGPGQPGRTPGATSALVTGAPSSNLGTGVNLDQLGVVRSGTWTIGSRQYVAPPPPPPVYPPAAPRDVTAIAGDKSATVSWREPASSGSFPVSNYKATASPGGQSCLVVAPALTCTVTGLANGTPYTFTVEALNGAGWGAKSTPSAPVTPGGVTPAPAPVPIPGPLPPGKSAFQVDGVVDPNVTVGPNAQGNGLRIDGNGWTMSLDGLGPDGKPLNLGPEGELRLQGEHDVVTQGTGFLPNSNVDLYVDPPVRTSGAGAREATEAIYVGTVRTDAKGDFAGTATLPDDIAPGDHVLQATGYSPSRQSRAMSLGVVVDPWIVLDKGTRQADGRHDRIRTTGTTGGLEPGTRLTPWIRYSGRSTFVEGKATIVVQGDGSFRWSRQIRKDRALTAYVSYIDTESNRVEWARVR